MTKQLAQLDKMVSQGKIEQAFAKYFHDDVVTWSGKKDKTKSKKEKMSLLKGFMESMESLDSCKFHGSVVDGTTSYSKFTFVFTNKSKEKLKWHEIIRRKWENGLVVDEFYYHEDFEDLKKRLEKKKAKTEKDESKAKSHKKGKTKKKKGKSKAENGFELLIADQHPIDNTKTPNTPTEIVKDELSIAEKGAPKKTAVQKQKVVIAEKETKTEVTETQKESKASTAPSLTSIKPKVIRTVKTPDLTIIEGIGPKIKELLGLDGIITFEQLAKAKAEDLKTMLLTRGGTRYNANNPSTWPEQAALAAAEKWEELKALKAELKFGKRV